MTINTDKAGCYGQAIRELKAEGKLPADTRHRQVKYLNNRVEAEHGKLKRVIRPTLGFKSMKTASATLKGFEVMRRSKRARRHSGSIRTGSGAKSASWSAPSALDRLGSARPCRSSRSNSPRPLPAMAS